MKVQNAASSLTISDWIKRFLDGDRDAFDVIHDTYRNSLWAFLCSRANNRDDAEELFSLVSITVARKLDSLEQHEKLVSWVLGIAQFKIREFYRRPKHHSLQVEDFVDELEDSDLTPEAQLASQEDMHQVHRCLRQLPEHQRTYIEQQFVAEIPQKDLAEQLGMNISALKSQVFRAKLKMLHCLRKHGVLPPETEGASMREGRELKPLQAHG